MTETRLYSAADEMTAALKINNAGGVFAGQCQHVDGIIFDSAVASVSMCAMNCKRHHVCGSNYFLSDATVVRDHIYGAIRVAMTAFQGLGNVSFLVYFFRRSYVKNLLV